MTCENFCILFPCLIVRAKKSNWILSDSKNPAGAGNFAERRNLSFFGTMRKLNFLPADVPTSIYEK
jgi:hypothetical protein